MKLFFLVGRVVDRRTGQVVREGQVELRHGERAEPVAMTPIDKSGIFRFEFSEERLQELFGGRTDLDIRFLRNGELLPSSGRRARWEVASERTFLRLAIDLPAEPVGTERIVVGSYGDLVQREEEILARINRTPNGARLFFLEPFSLLADVAVEVTPEAREEILKLHPGLRTVSRTPYEALKRSARHQSLRFRIRALTHSDRREP